MIAIVDYGVGNLFSLRSSLQSIGADCVVTGSPTEIAAAHSVILPGVGAFGDAAAKLRESGLGEVVVAEAKKGKPLLGICLGMQLLFDKSEEYGEHTGLGLIAGEIKSLGAALGQSPLKVPHMGWNNLALLQDCQLLKNTAENDCVYYVHSFYASLDRRTVAASQYGPVKIAGVVQRGNIFGTQFHPEKSGETGLNILRAFAEIG